jgi:LPXTG-motif cell wall-anchored protein
MKKRTRKTMKYRLRTGSQWLLISLIITSTILPGVTATVTALTEETTVLENIDTNQENEAELPLENDDSTEELAVAQEDENDTDNSISSESMESFDGGESHRGETTVNEKLLETSKKSEITVKDANDIDSGTAGSVPWRIDSERTLHFGEGKLSENPSNVSTGVWGWRNSTVVKKIIFEGKVTTSGTLLSMFMGMSAVVQIENLDYLDTSNVTNMNNMFNGMSSLTELDVSSFDMSKVTQGNYLFAGTNKLSKLTLGKNFKFVGNPSLPSIGTSSIYTGKWVNIASGTIENPYGTNIWSSTEFGENYNGVTDADTYVWQKTGENVIVKYVDEINNSIVGIPEKTISGAIGESYDVSSAEWQISIPGYRLNQENLPVNMFGKFTNQAQEVVYSYIKDKTAINVHDSNLYVGDEWKAENNFDSALDKDGNKVDFKDVTVTGDVDTSKTGTYEVTYSYDGIESKATITVKDKHTAVNVHDSNLYVGDEWKAENNFDSALDKDGNKVDFKDVTVTGDVDTSKAGTYEVTYSYDGVESKATITVLEVEEGQDLAHIVVHDSELEVGEDWLPEDNFDEATSSDGEEEYFSDIIVSGTVDTQKPGTYEVTYSIPEEHWGRGLVEGHHTATAKIVVSEKENKDSGSKGEGTNSDKDDLSSTDELSGENNTQSTKGLPTTGEHTSALAFMIGIALLVLGSIFSVLRVKKNKK